MQIKNVVKGRIAESLVSELLKKSRNKVYRFGYETVLQNLTQLEASFNKDTKTAEIIRSIPDLIVVNRNGEVFFVEVKERTKKVGRYFFTKTEWGRLKEVLNYWNAVLILVTAEPPFFRIFDGSLRNSFVPIEKYGKFNIKETACEECNKLAEKYFRDDKNKNQFNGE